MSFFGVSGLHEPRDLNWMLNKQRKTALGDRKNRHQLTAREIEDQREAARLEAERKAEELRRQTTLAEEAAPKEKVLIIAQ